MGWLRKHKTKKYIIHIDSNQTTHEKSNSFEPTNSIGKICSWHSKFYFVLIVP